MWKGEGNSFVYLSTEEIVGHGVVWERNSWGQCMQHGSREGSLCQRAMRGGGVNELCGRR